ncbi:MAG: aminotransferase class V-fold PLP-dependent enzyme [Vicingaceae bacterium]
MSNRRDFIKKNALAAIYASTIGPFTAFGASQSKSAKVDFSALSGDSLWRKVRAEFPLFKRKVYFNVASLGPASSPTVKEIQSQSVGLAENGRDGRWLIEESREKFAAFLNAKTAEICFCRNATEGMNMVANVAPLKSGDEVILTDQEHIGGSAPWLALAKEKGIKVKVVELDLTGEKVLQQLKESVSEKTKMISFSHVCCTTGLVLPAEEIVAFCREKNIMSCVDGAQALGMFPLDLKSIKPDFYAASGHKWMFGPIGSGLLYVNQNIIEKCNAGYAGAFSDQHFDLEGKSLKLRQEASRWEYGTRNSIQVAAMAASLEMIKNIGIARIQARGKELRNSFREKLEKEEAITILSPQKEEFASSIFTFRLDRGGNQEMVEKLRQNGFVCRYIYEADLDAIRLSFSIMNLKEELNQFHQELMALYSAQ